VTQSTAARANDMIARARPMNPPLTREQRSTSSGSSPSSASRTRTAATAFARDHGFVGRR
jgi:hypothetical protein